MSKIMDVPYAGLGRFWKGTFGLSYRWMVRSLVLIVLAMAVVYAVHFLLFTRTGVHLTHANVKQLSNYLQSLGPWSYVFGIGAVLLQIFFPVIPFVIVAGANVLAFGLYKGFCINYVTSCAGAVIAFLFARYIGHDWVERKLARYPATKEFNRKLESHGFFYVFIGRLIPIIPSSAINLGAGVTKTRFNHFLAGTVLGKFPLVLLESFIGHDLLHISRHRGRLVALLVVLVLLMLLGSWIKKKISAKRADEEGVS